MTGCFSPSRLRWPRKCWRFSCEVNRTVLPSSLVIGRPRKSSMLVNRLPHCDCSRLHHRHALGRGLLQPAEAGHEVHMRITAVPAVPGRVEEPPDPQRQLPGVVTDRHDRVKRLVVESARHPGPHLAPWQPALAGAVHVGVGGAAEPHVGADVDVPAAQVAVDVLMVPVRLVGHAVGRAEVHPARHRLAGGVIHDRRADPVAAKLGHPQPCHPGETLSAQVRPSCLRYRLSAGELAYRARASRGHPGVNAGYLRAGRISPGRERITRLRRPDQRRRIAGGAAVDLQRQVRAVSA